MSATSPRVSLRVESIADLRARYHASITDLYDQLEVASGERYPPSALERHVFDTPDGWRLIVSLERTPNGMVGIHLSGSIHNARLVMRSLRDWEGDQGLHKLIDAVIGAWQSLAKSDKMPTFLGLSEKGVPHFFLNRGDA